MFIIGLLMAIFGIWFLLSGRLDESTHGVLEMCNEIHSGNITGEAWMSCQGEAWSNHYEARNTAYLITATGTLLTLPFLLSIVNTPDIRKK